MLTKRFQLMYLHDRESRSICRRWKDLGRNIFAQLLDLAYPDLSTTSAGARTFGEKISQINLQFSLKDVSYETLLDEKLDTICDQHPDRSVEDEALAIAMLIKKPPQDGPVNWRARFHLTSRVIPGGVTTVEDFRLALDTMLRVLRDSISVLSSFGCVISYSDNAHVRCDLPLVQPHSVASVTRKRPMASSSKEPSCTGCGRSNHLPAQCHFKSSQYYNHTSAPFLSSPNGQRFLLSFPGKTVIPGKRADTDPATLSSAGLSHCL